MKNLTSFLLLGLLIWNVAVTLKIADYYNEIQSLKLEIYKNQASIEDNKNTLVNFIAIQGTINSQMEEAVKSTTVYINPYFAPPQPQSKVEYTQ